METNSTMEYASNKNLLLCQVQSSSHLSNTEQSQISLSLDRYCKTNILDESADFIDSGLKSKFKHEKNKKEVFLCEICKEDIIHLNVNSRSIHVNNCIDKQMSSTSLSTIKSAESNNIFILECPLCFKNFSSPELRANHAKKCGKSKGLDTQNIIKALELQERHALERVALGLPAKLPKPVKSLKNPSNKRGAVEPKNKSQSDIQLAKALSLSITNTEQVNQNLVSTITLKAPKTQHNPGKLSKQKIRSTPLLILMAEEDRKKLLLDKVASIVASVSENDDTFEAENPVSTVEYKKNANEMPLLWRLCGSSSEKFDYYVEELLDWITPADIIEAGAKMCHLSQIPGHEIVTQLPCEYTFSSEDKNNKCLEVSHLSSSSSPVIDCLRSLVASSWMSDVDISTACGTLLPAHKLLLAARCPPLKQDLDFCFSSQKVVLKWENISFDAALQFLNFVYTGSMEAEEKTISDLFYLSKKYEVYDLLAQLNANWKFQHLFEVESKENNFEDADEIETSSPSSDAVITKDVESQEEVNPDLEIVYHCINSNLRPTQFSTQESVNSTNSKPSLNLLELDEQNNNASSMLVNEDAPEMSINMSPVKSLNKEFYPVSPMIFDVNDSEDDVTPLLGDDNLPDLNSTMINVENFRSSERECSKSPVIFDVVDSENDGSDDNACSESPFKSEFKKDCSVEHNHVLDQNTNRLATHIIADTENFSANEGYHSASPVIFDVNDSEDDLSENESSVLSNLPKKIVHVRKQQDIDLNSGKSNSSDDSVKFLACSQKVVKNDYEHIEQISSTASRSPKSSSSSILIPSEEVSPNLQNNLDYQKMKKKILECESGNKIDTVGMDTTLMVDGFYNEIKECETMSCLSHKISPGTGDFHSTLKFNFKYSIPDYAIDANQNVASSCSKSPSWHSDDTLPLPVKDDFEECSSSKSIAASGDVYFGSEELISSCKKIDIFKNQNVSKIHSHTDIERTRNNSVSPEVICFSSDNENSSVAEELSSGQESRMVKTIDRNFESGEIDSSKILQTSYQFIDDCAFDEPYVYFGSSPKQELDLEPTVVTVENHGDNLDDVIHNKPHRSKLDSTYEKQVTTILQSASNVSEQKSQYEDLKIAATPSSKQERELPQFQLSDSPVTPFPDYKTMMTPDIKQALKRYGVKAMPRRKAVALLSHIYNETHPMLNGEAETSSIASSPTKRSKLNKVTKCKKRKFPNDNSDKTNKKTELKKTSFHIKGLSLSSEGSSSENSDANRLGYIPEISFSQCTQDSPTKNATDQIELIKNYIFSNEQLYSNILSYVPLNMVDFHQELKSNGIKISIQKLMDFLDEQCITFTCPRNEEYKKKQTARANRFRKNMISKMSQQPS